MRSNRYPNQARPPMSVSKRMSPSVTMSSPARTWSFTSAATASKYCSR